MRATQQLQRSGQSLWLDNITRDLLDDGTLARYVADDAITGLTSNPTIFKHALESGSYDADIAAGAGDACDEDVFFDLALSDLRRACDLFAPAHAASDGVDGWASIEVSPHLAHDTAGTVSEACRLHREGERENLFVKIPGTAAGFPAIAECTFAGVPINVTLLFSVQQYRNAFAAYCSGLERRIGAGLDPRVPSVASLFVSRWDRAVAGTVPAELENRLGLAVAANAYRAYREQLDSPRWRRLERAGARPQRLLWASTSAKSPDVSDVVYVEGLIAPDTINTMPEATLAAFADHGAVGAPLPEDGGDADRVLAEFASAGIDVQAVAARLLRDGLTTFDLAWSDLLGRIVAKRHELAPGRG